MAALIGPGAFIALGCIIVWLVQGVRQRWKRAESERIDDQGALPWGQSLRGWVLLPLARFLRLGQGQGCGQGGNQALEDGQESETRPLLSG